MVNELDMKDQHYFCIKTERRVECQNHYRNTIDAELEVTMLSSMTVNNELLKSNSLTSINKLL